MLTCATLHASKVRDIEVKVVDAPGEVRCGAGFTISLTIKNWSSQQMELSLKEEQASVDAILLDGQSGSVLGTVNPAGTLVSDLLILRSQRDLGRKPRDRESEGDGEMCVCVRVCACVCVCVSVFCGSGGFSRVLQQVRRRR